ncbi:MULTISPECIES: Lrp/AsnC family transcriptional regulator [unclassified Leucobacter]|uniref:Lrp/AsnC family transcriptional regulator n=1 Tax=unclassified Leucobacter TaxID=2621730 RepID=UPI00165E198E|nr:Lrp/AsnC family transcriptional regulator [Leucobacter sp. cx-87]
MTPPAAPHDSPEERVITALRRDGRISFSALAARTGLGRAQVSEIARGLIADEQLRFTTSVSPLQFGFAVEGHLVLAVRGGAEALAAELVASPLTTFVSLTTGETAICAQLRCRDRTELAELLDRVRSHPAVLNSGVHLYDRVHRNVYAPVRASDEPDRLDATDIRLASALERDGRASVRALATELGLPEGSVRHRLGRLFDADIVRVVAVPTRDTGRAVTLGFGVQHIGSADQAAAELILLGADFVATAVGDWGVLGTTQFPTLAAAQRFIAEVRHQAWVAGLSTWLHLEILKEDYSVSQRGAGERAPATGG